MSPRGNRCSAVPHPRVVEQFPTNLLRAATGVEGIVPAQRLWGVCGGARRERARAEEGQEIEPKEPARGRLARLTVNSV